MSWTTTEERSMFLVAVESVSSVDAEVVSSAEGEVMSSLEAEVVSSAEGELVSRPNGYKSWYFECSTRCSVGSSRQKVQWQRS